VTLRAALAAGLLAVWASTVGACGVAAPDAQALGVISAALSTVGSDGATYSLPSTARLTLAEKGGFTTTVPLSGSATETLWVPPGVYAATLSQPGDAGTLWTLERAGDGGPTSVSAVLTDTMPVSLTVVASETTPLIFHFTTATLGNVTFGTGGASVGVALDAGGFPVQTAKITGTTTMSVDAVDGGSAALDKAFRFTGTVSVPFTLSLTRSGGWISAADQACAPVTGTASSTSTNAALAAVFTEASGGAGSLCFGDANLSGAFAVHLARTGAPTTSTLKTDLPDGGTFEVDVTGYAPDVFNGTTLTVGSLPEPFTPVGVGVAETVSSKGIVLARIDGTPSGTATVTLTR